MSDPFADRPLPKGPLIAAAALIGISLVFAATARLTNSLTGVVPEATPVESRDLRFEDGGNAVMLVYATADEQLIAALPTATNGFIWGVLRSFARQRKLNAIAPEQPFRLTRWSDGRVSLEDLATARRVELDSFGPTNANAFARLLAATGEQAKTHGARYDRDDS